MHTIESVLDHPLKNIVILRALQLGDLLCAIPALRAIRNTYTYSNVTLVGLPWSRNFTARFNCYFDDWIEFPGFPGFPERAPDIASFPGFLSTIQRRNYDLALQMQGSGYLSNSITALFGAKLMAGFYTSGSFCPDPATFLEYPENEPEVRRHLKLMAFLGIAEDGDHLDFPITARDEEDFSHTSAAHLQPGSYICIHPGARSIERRWSADKFAAVGDHLASAGWQVVLTGSINEMQLTAAVKKRMRHSALDLAGSTTMGALAVLLSRARLLICNDTGVSHLADALCLPSVVLFSASDPRRWAPLDRVLHRTIHNVALVEPNEVIREVEGVLEGELYACSS